MGHVVCTFPFTNGVSLRTTINVLDAVVLVCFVTQLIYFFVDSCYVKSAYSWGAVPNGEDGGSNKIEDRFLYIRGSKVRLGHTSENV